MTDRPPVEHYSYAVYADPEIAERFDDRRFGGPIGEIVAGSQARVLSSFAEPVAGRAMLDVGTGTGRAAILLARAGARVTAVDASAQMLAVARRRAEEADVQVAFAVGDAHALEFADRSFEVAVGLRILMHAVDWRGCIGELCRVADELVIVDYPAVRSLALLQSVARRGLAALGARTEPYRVLTDRAVASALAAHGFRVRSVHRQFVLPIAVHKAIGSARFTHQSERLFDRAGVLDLAGSPVTLVAERCRPS